MERVGEALGRLWRCFGEALGGFGEFLGKLWGGIEEALGGFGKALGKLWGGIEEALGRPNKHLELLAVLGVRISKREKVIQIRSIQMELLRK